MRQRIRILWLRLKLILGIESCSDREELAYWITRNVETPSGLNVHDVCEMEWDSDYV